MTKKILIVDDDPDFCSLLAEIFKKQPYTIYTEASPVKALERLKKEPIDLVITDERMPEMRGCELIQAGKELGGNTHFIIVSAYLDSESVRNFINKGIGGVFIKPLNIFGLLKCAQDILSDDHVEEKQLCTLEEKPLEFEFHSMPCYALKSREFANKLSQRCHFKTSLILTGEPGLPLKDIAKDLESLCNDDRDFFEILTPQTLSEKKLLEILERTQSSNCDKVTLFILQTGRLTQEQQMLLYDLNRQIGPFIHSTLPIRFVFCLEQPIENLYEDGVLTDKLYLIMGSSEIRVPSLSECPEDIIPLAENYLRSINENRSGSFINFREDALEVLGRHHWTHNHAELFNCIEIASAESRGASFITKDAIESALKSARAALPEVLKVQLTAYRNDYIGAVLILTDGNFKRAAELLDVSPELIKVVAD